MMLRRCLFVGAVAIVASICSVTAYVRSEQPPGNSGARQRFVSLLKSSDSKEYAKTLRDARHGSLVAFGPPGAPAGGPPSGPPPPSIIQ